MSQRGNILVVCLCILLLYAHAQNEEISICVKWPDGICVGGNDSLTSTDVVLTYGMPGEDFELVISKTTSDFESYTLNCSDDCSYFFEQNEHGGGDCNCVDIYFNSSCSTNENAMVTLCGGSASIPRRNTTQGNDFLFQTKDFQNKENPFNRSCQSSNICIHISFVIYFNRESGCNTINDFNEGVEVSLRLSSSPSEWIPITFLYREQGKDIPSIDVGSQNNFTLRGYLTDVKDLTEVKSTLITTTLCCFNSTNSIQFRWLQTSQFTSRMGERAKDTWSIDNIEIDVLSNESTLPLLNESFESNSTNDQWWRDRIRNGMVSNHCNLSNSRGLVFGLSDQNYTDSLIISSRSLRTEFFNLSILDQCSNEHISNRHCSFQSEASSTTKTDNNIFSSTPSSDFSIVVDMKPTLSYETIPLMTTSYTLSESVLDSTDKASSYDEVTVPSSTFLPDYGDSESELIIASTHYSVQPSPTSDAPSDFPSIVDMKPTSPPYETIPLMTTSHTLSESILDFTDETSSYDEVTVPSSTFLPDYLHSESEIIIASTRHSLQPSPTSDVPIEDSGLTMSHTESILSMSDSLNTNTVHTSSVPDSTTDHSDSNSVVSTTSFIAMPQTNKEKVQHVEQQALTKINDDHELNSILTEMNHMDAFTVLYNVSTMRIENSSLWAYLYVRIISTIDPANISNSLETILTSGIRILSITSKLEYSLDSMIAAQSLFLAFEYLLFQYIPENGTFVKLNIALQIVTVDLNHDKSDEFLSINTSLIPQLENGLEMAITLPRELLEYFSNSTDGRIRVVSSVYINVANALKNNSVELASDVIGSSLQCGIGPCPTANYTLQSSNVSMSFEHSETLREILQNQSNLTTDCVFLDITKNTGTILNIADWSTRGCTRNAKLSSIHQTVCDCNHLTHFAILLSASPQELPDPVTLSLEIIGYVGVAVSLVAMTLTVITFVMLKPLRSMRNYIHINLCISLAVSQVIFVAGVDKTSLPISCQTVAVLLHYFFLVTFMWMLMEGVVLYVALVRVFVKHKKRYIIGFTTVSYGLPLLYMGLTVPLGFLLPNQPNYGYDKACFLNPHNHFIWAMIVPVILIFLANFGFFIMAATIMWKHQKKQTEKTKSQNIKSWLKSAVSLVVIMGLTWSLGIVVIGRVELLPLIYIYTTMVAFQGLIIFLIFVVFSKTVRESYIKCWRAKVNSSDFLSNYFGEKHLRSSASKSNRNLIKSSSKSYTTVTKQTTDGCSNGHIEMDSLPINQATSEDHFLIISNTSCSLSKSDFGSAASISDDCPEFSATYSEDGEILVESSTTLQVH